MGAKIPRGCCSSDRPAPARRCWRAPSPARPACRSSRSRARTSWRCSWASGRAGAGPVRAGEGERPGDRLHRRDRRGRASARRRARRWARRARADAEPAAGRDGRIRSADDGDPDGGHEPSRHPRPGAAAAGAIRPSGRDRPPRSRGPQGDPAGARPRQAVRRHGRSRRARSTHARVHRRRPRERDQRGGVARGPSKHEGDLDEGDRGSRRPCDGRPRAQEPRHGRGGAPPDRLPRGWARDGCARVAQHRRGAQDHRDPSGSRPRDTRSRCPSRTGSS